MQIAAKISKVAFVVGLCLQFSSARAGTDDLSILWDENRDSSWIELTRRLVANASSDQMKLDRIFQYVIQNITYDHAAYHLGRRRINRDSDDVLHRKKAVCWGYSELLRQMCIVAGLRCETISGYAAEPQTPPRALEKADHAWNAVELDSTWYLIDATWASGTYHEGTTRTQVFLPAYYLANPKEFIQTHFPLMPMWQLLDCPISLEEFQKRKMDFSQYCDYSYRDSIEEYLQLPLLEQKAKATLVAYRINHTMANREIAGHALVDLAIQLKERADDLMEADSSALAIESLEAAQSLFDMAGTYCQFYPWQVEAKLFTMINLGQAYYKKYKATDQNDLIRSQFLSVKNSLPSVPLRASVSQHILQLCNQYLAVIE